MDLPASMPAIQMLTTGNFIQCPVCSKQFPWDARYAGRKARCVCGRIVEYPDAPPLAPDVLAQDGDGPQDEYDLAPNTPAPATVVAHPVQDRAETISDQPAAPSRILSYRTNPGIGSNSGPVDLDTEKVTKQILPLWILTGGLLVEGFVAFLHARSNPTPAMIHLFVSVGAGTLLMMAGVMIAARVRQIQFGSYASAALRLSAVVVGVAAVNDLLAPLAGFIPFGGLGLLLVSFALYFALLGAFFDLDESDTWYCICVIFLVHLVVYFASMVMVK
jgi:hypothetical protein